MKSQQSFLISYVDHWLTIVLFVSFLRKKRLSARATLPAPVETVEPALPSVKTAGPSVIEQRVPQ
jgi:hypothetical protein